LKEFFKKAGKVILKTVMWFFILSISWVVLYRWVNPPGTYLMLLRKGQLLFSNEKDKGIYYEWKDLKDISANMPLAVIASEDQNFLNHWGFDFEAIQSAVKYNQTHKHKIGASTISQQVAKNVFLFPSRNFVRKGLEVYFTFLIEMFWSKKRIMEVYLNVVEMNRNRFGVQQGSVYAYNCSAKRMSIGQCARLAAILPGPRKFSAKNPSGYIYLRQQQITVQIYYLGPETSKAFH
jgi:monofunctional biosynthetic peptidoglycan transglycosylase